MFDFEDLYHDCLSHWFVAKKKFKAGGKATEKTFMGRVVRNKLFDIVKSQERICRKQSQFNLSLDKPLLFEADHFSLLDVLPCESPSPPELIIEQEYQVKITQVIKTLPRKQQELCRLLGDEGLSVTDASRKLNTPRSTIYDELDRIRAIFSKEKLDEYFY